jgi:hypothetical protein
VCKAWARERAAAAALSRIRAHEVRRGVRVVQGLHGPRPRRGSPSDVREEPITRTSERSYGSFTRTFTLPDQVDTTHVKAELKGGELTVVVPKTAAAVAKKIPVAAGDKSKS